jgi:hypothetical protein
MLRTSLLALGTLVAVTAWTTGHATTATPSAPTSDPVPASESDGTVIATIEIDHRGVRVLAATRKPTLAFRAPRAADDLLYGWVLRDAAGTVLAESGFDPAKVCRDPSHAGQPPHVEGCEVIPHTGYANVKLPDFGARAATLEFVYRSDTAPLLSLGAIRWASLPLR